MITRIKAKGFKGLEEFDNAIGPLTIFIGENGVGKSARVQAIALAIQGFIPGKGKTNQAIFEAGVLAGQDRFAVEVNTSHKVSFYRRWKKQNTGAVNVDLLVNGRKASAQVFESEMGRCCGYVVGDLAMFMGLSDRKKIDEIFSLYPPAGELSDIERQLTDKREALNKNQQKMKIAESVLAKLRSQRSMIEAPGKSMDDSKAEYEQVAAVLCNLRETLKQQEAVERTKQTVAEVFNSPNPDPDKAGGQTAEEYVTNWPETAINSLKAVLDIIKRAGCASCAATLVIKREIRKIRGAAI